MKIKSSQRKAISPVLATVILIAITLIAAIAIAGFVFGLFSGFTSSARVQVISVSLPFEIYSAGECTGVPNCTIYFANTGTANTNVNTIVLTYGGVTCTASIAAAVSIPATGVQTAVTLNGVGGCGAGVAGQAFTGYGTLSNGGQAQFSGTFT